MARKLKTMTCAELIEHLQSFPGQTPVVFAYDYGDHCHSTVTAEIKNVEEGSVGYSEYHRMFKDETELDTFGNPLHDDADAPETFEEEKFTKAIILR